MPCGCGKNVPQLSPEEVAARAERLRVAQELKIAARAAKQEELQQRRERSERLRRERREEQLRARAARMASRQ